MRRLLVAIALLCAVPATAGWISADASNIVKAGAGFNVRDYGAKGDGSTDDTSAFTAAFNAAMASGPLAPCVFIPPGNYILSAPLPTFSDFAGCVLGGGRQKTILTVAPAMSGTLLSWSEAWLGGDNHPGPILEDLTIVASRASPNTQNAVVFYDRNDFVDMERVNILNFTGSCLAAGQMKNKRAAYIRESDFSDIKAWYCGGATAPAVVFDTQGSIDPEGTNEIKISSLDIFAPYGHGLQILSSGIGTTRMVNMSKVRIEGLYPNSGAIAADLLVLGDAVQTGHYALITCAECEFIDPYAGQWAIRVDSPSWSPYGINIDGFIGGGAPLGGGLDLQVGHNNRFYFSVLGTQGPNLKYGPGQPNITDVLGPAGSQSTWTISP